MNRDRKPKRTRDQTPKQRAQTAALLLVAIVMLLSLILLVMPRRPIQPGQPPRPAAGASRSPVEEQAPATPAPETEPGSRPQGAGQPEERRGTSWPAPSAERPAQPAPLPVAAAGLTVPGRPGRLVLVVDDAGHSLDDLRPFLDLPVPLVVSVLPDLPFSRQAADAAREAGKEVLLHAPMEAVNGEDPGPGAITTVQSGEEVRGLLERHFAALPDAVGLNNHMGSRATADERLMGEVMSYMAAGGRIFLDSRTTVETVAESQARRYGARYLARDVFVDNTRDSGAIRLEILRGADLALRKGYAVLIGHATNPATAETLAGCLPELERRGVRWSTLGELMKERETEHAGVGD